MFSFMGLFGQAKCPDIHCTRTRCIFSHSSDSASFPTLDIPVEDNIKQSSSSSLPLSASGSAAPQYIVPAKRPAVPSPASSHTGSPNGREPPRKLQKTGTAQRPIALPASQSDKTGVPILRVNAAQSQVPIPVRQAMLKTLYDHFNVLYQSILSLDPTLAHEHSLLQEQEVYNKSTKQTYRNAVINTVASIKKRAIPDSVGHASVGTEGDVLRRAEERKALERLRLTAHHLDPLVMSRETMERWGFMVDVPGGEGGSRPSHEGKVTPCDRCGQPYQVTSTPDPNECTYHWGKMQYRVVNGERIRAYTCCLRVVGVGEGCVTGPHVFYEKNVDDLHARHPFSFTAPAETSTTAHDVLALDCEMIYTTGGMRVARVSVVDGVGATVMDEFVRMDEGVTVVDYNTRFSGVTADDMAKAVLPLQKIRKALDDLVNHNTILIGHALDNDLKTLRMIHHRCVDTCILFPHRGGNPYRRALRDLAKEKLGLIIQTGGGTSGHSSVEDSIATLDLVRWYVLNRQTQPPNQESTASQALKTAPPQPPSALTAAVSASS